MAVHSDNDDDSVAMCISVADNEREKNKTRFYLIGCGSSWVVLLTKIAAITKELSDHCVVLLFHLELLSATTLISFKHFQRHACLHTSAIFWQI